MVVILPFLTTVKNRKSNLGCVQDKQAATVCQTTTDHYRPRSKKIMFNLSALQAKK